MSVMFNSQLIFIWFVSACLLNAATSIPILSDFQKSIAEAHKATALELNDGGHKLSMRTMVLSASEKLCPEHFKCWSGEIDGEVYESRQLFLDGTYHMSDMIISVEQEHAYVWVGCENNMVELPLSFIHASDNMIYTSSAYEKLLDKCRRRLILSVRKVSWMKHPQNSNHKLSVQLIVNSHANLNSTNSAKFVELFHRKLREGTNESAHEDAPSSTSTTPPASSAVRNRRSAVDDKKQTCNQYATVLNLSALQKYVTLIAGDEAHVMSQSSTNFYYCTGSCKSIQLFLGAKSPLTEDQVHDDYWTTVDILTTEHVISVGPKASCISYAYSFFEIIYMIGSDSHVEYIYYPTQCACV